MKKKQVSVIAITLVGFSAINILFTQLAGTQQNIVVQLVRFALTSLVAYHLMKGKNWARVLVSALLGLGALITVVALPGLLPKGFEVAPFRVIWMITMGILFGSLSAYLALSKNVKKECEATNIESPSELEPNAEQVASDNADVPRE